MTVQTMSGNAAPPFRYCWTHFWSTSWSSNYAYNISFQSLGSQESSASNGMRFGGELKKLWLFEDKRAKLSGNFAHLNPRCEKFSHRAKPSLGTRVPFRTPQATFRTVRNKVRIPQSKVWKFRTMQFKVRNSHFKVRKFCYCWTRFWSTSWSSNYSYHISFWSLGSQESSASNGAWFGFETKKL